MPDAVPGAPYTPFALTVFEPLTQVHSPLLGL
jgi:hypothetical protein